MIFQCLWSAVSARPLGAGISGSRMLFVRALMPSASPPVWTSRGSSSLPDRPPFFDLGFSISDGGTPDDCTEVSVPPGIRSALYFEEIPHAVPYLSRISGRWLFHSGGEGRRTSCIPKAELSGPRSGISFADPGPLAPESWLWSTISRSPSPPPKVAQILVTSGSRFAKSLACVSLRTVG